MKRDELKSRKDISLLALLVGGATFAFIATSSTIRHDWRVAGILFVLLSFVVGSLGRSRKIGFGGAFFASFLLFGLLAVSSRFRHQKQQKKNSRRKYLI